MVLGHRLGSFRDGVLGELTRKDQPDSRLNLASRDAVILLVTVSQMAGLGSKPLEHVVQEGIHHGHRLHGHLGVWMNRLQHTVDVGGVRAEGSLLPLLGLVTALGADVRSLARLGGRFCHVDVDS